MALFTYCRAGGVYQYAALIWVRQPSTPAFGRPGDPAYGPVPQVRRQHFSFNRSNTRRAADRAEHLNCAAPARTDTAGAGDLFF